MFLVGITGGLSCGKTEVAKIFEKLGAKIISADAFGREAVENNKCVLRKLIFVFGNDILNKDNTLNRRKLAELAFASKSGVKELNSIVHPYLLSALEEKIKKISKNKDIVVIDAALIVEWGLEKKLDFLIVVDSKTKDQIKRFCSATNYSSKTACNIIRCQLPKTTKKKYADLIVYNYGNLKQLKEKARRAWDDVIRESKKKKKITERLGGKKV